MIFSLSPNCFSVRKLSILGKPTQQVFPHNFFPNFPQLFLTFPNFSKISSTILYFPQLLQTFLAFCQLPSNFLNFSQCFPTLLSFSNFSNIFSIFLNFFLKISLAFTKNKKLMSDQIKVKLPFSFTLNVLLYSDSLPTCNVSPRPIYLKESVLTLLAP